MQSHVYIDQSSLVVGYSDGVAATPESTAQAMLKPTMHALHTAAYQNSNDAGKQRKACCDKQKEHGKQGGACCEDISMKLRPHMDRTKALTATQVSPNAWTPFTTQAQLPIEWIRGTPDHPSQGTMLPHITKVVAI